MFTKYRTRPGTHARQLFAAVLMLVVVGAAGLHARSPAMGPAADRVAAVGMVDECAGRTAVGLAAGGAHCAASGLCWHLSSDQTKLAPKSPARPRAPKSIVVPTICLDSPPEAPPRAVA